MLVTYDPALIALSILVAIQGGYVSLQLACRLPQLHGARKKAILAIAAIALGGGIWAMHFIGMLALQLPVAINYDVLLTLVSFLVSILVTGIGLYIAGYGRLTLPRLMSAGLFMGLGISLMHYVGMAAVRANCIIDYSPGLVALSIGVGITASTLALWLAFTPRIGWRTMMGAVILGLAISGMHYTAMAAATFLPADVLLALSAPALSQHLLAIVVAVATFLISGFFLLGVLPDRPRPAAVRDAKPAGPALSATEPKGAAGSPAPALERLAVEKNGRTILLEPNQIFSIKAEAHYSRVFDGTDDYFCSRSLSELQDQLDPRLFIRVHRSHIVNIRHARAFEKEREQGLIHLNCESGLSVPVSRKNLPKLRAALGI